MSCQLPITTHSGAVCAVVALGSNLAHGGYSPAQLIGEAASRLQPLSRCTPHLSSIYSTAAVGLGDEAPAFCNAVAIIEPALGLSAQELLDKLLSIELDLGRVRRRPAAGASYASRTIDLDLIFCRDEIIDSATLKLPHPRAAERAFVLEPLAELWPDLVLPGQSLTVCELLKKLTLHGQDL